jgi:hypothetical protein
MAQRETNNALFQENRDATVVKKQAAIVVRYAACWLLSDGIISAGLIRLDQPGIAMSVGKPVKHIGPRRIYRDDILSVD